jgi:hypothetical protein
MVVNEYMRCTYMANHLKGQVSPRGLGHVLGAFWQVWLLAKSLDPSRTRRPGHEQVADGLVSSCELEQVRRV